MSKSNWKGTSGWGAINDPTGVLDGRVLVASAGVSATNEDYLLSIVGTSTSFTAKHYSVYCDYAFPNYNETHPFISGKLGLIARAGNFNGDPESAYDCYVGRMNVENKTVQIIRRVSNEETILKEALMPNSAIARGAKHTMELKCYGEDSTTLQLLLDGSIVAQVGDTSSNRLQSGYAGLQVSSGTAYVDTFTPKQYTSDGDTPSEWTPIQLGAGVTLSAWYIADKDVTVTGSTVTAWADQSGNGNDLTASGQPVLVTDAVNNYDAVKFGLNDCYMQVADNSTLDMNAKGVSIFAVVAITNYGLGGIVAKSSTYELQTNATGGYKFIGNPTDNVVPSSFAGISNVFHMVGAVTDKDNDTGVGGIWVDGSNVAGITFNAGSDNANAFYIGRTGANNVLNGSISEVVVVKGEVTTEQRQLIEGYLAQKYATWTKLPSNHPYRSYAPIIQE